MEICKEMIKLRKGLDERGIVWIDASDIYENDKIKALGVDITIYRIQFTAYGVWFSVIYGHGTYGKESGLLECMSKAVNPSREPKGSMTANEILEVIDGLKNKKRKNKKRKNKKAIWIKGAYWSEGCGMGEIYGNYYKCSNCKKKVQDDYMECSLKYCPNCGARMDGDVNEID